MVRPNEQIATEAFEPEMRERRMHSHADCLYAATDYFCPALDTLTSTVFVTPTRDEPCFLASSIAAKAFITGAAAALLTLVRPIGKACSSSISCQPGYPWVARRGVERLFSFAEAPPF